LMHESKALKGNALGDPDVRKLGVYLPPGYDDDLVSTFPTVYLLTGFTGRGTMMLNESAFEPNIAERLDRLIEGGKVRPMIAVLPDCFTRLGGSQYINSSATGNYEDYLTEEIVPFIDHEFRTSNDAGSRAVAGKSSGGYGALILGMRHSDLFGSVASIAGDCYFEYCYKPGFSTGYRAIAGDPMNTVEKFWNEEAKKGKNDFDALNTLGMAACYSPNPESPWGFDLPFDTETGEVLEDVWAKWLEHDPVNLVKLHVEALRSLRLLYIDAGTSDEFGLDIGASILCSRLDDLGVSYVRKEFDGGHFNINHRYNQALMAISEAFGNER